MIFALDVGTRTVIGLVLEPRSNRLNIKAAAVEEHQGRAMLDGQIQDIPEVAEVVKKVKAKLEKKLDIELSKVSVAAAGRALKTIEAQYEKECDPSFPITKNEIYALQIEGLNEAQKKISGDRNARDYYCVGYSVKSYQLDGITIQNLEGQYGNSIKIELIATFLPRIVVDSLFSVLNKCGLVIENLTLEPIAASHLIIEPGMRKLNLALVDIGAGTSDIAVSREGAMVAYGMVPSAGDEITEKISEEYLVDFATAEKIKRQLKSNGSIKFKDVLGNERNEKTKTIIDRIESAVEKLAQKIADEILKLNGKAPGAVICIGGGSQTPGLAEKIAQKLNLTIDRVAIRDRNAVKTVNGFPKSVKGPEFVTPLGIAFSQWQGNGTSLEFVEVNGKMVRVFGDKKLKVIDVLYAAGISGSAVYGKPGRGITLEVNGKLKLVPGGRAMPAQIKINNKKSSLDELVNKGDKIDFKPAQPGKPAEVKVRDIIPNDLDKDIIFNGNKIVIKPRVLVNGKIAAPNTKLEDNDSVYWEDVKNVNDLFKYCKYSNSDEEQILVNGKKASLDTKLKDGDVVITKYEKKQKKYKDGLSVEVNGEKINIPGNSAILLDVFSVYNIQTTPPHGKKKLVIEVNGTTGSFTTPLKEGDVINLYWK